MWLPRVYLAWLLVLLTVLSPSIHQIHIRSNLFYYLTLPKPLTTNLIQEPLFNIVFLMILHQNQYQSLLSLSLSLHETPPSLKPKRKNKTWDVWSRFIQISGPWFIFIYFSWELYSWNLWMGSLTRQLSWWNKEDSSNVYIVCIFYGH